MQHHIPNFRLFPPPRLSYLYAIRYLVYSLVLFFSKVTTFSPKTSKDFSSPPIPFIPLFIPWKQIITSDKG